MNNMLHRYLPPLHSAYVESMILHTPNNTSVKKRKENVI